MTCTFCLCLITEFSTHILTRRMTGIHTRGVKKDDFSTHILTRRMTSAKNGQINGKIFSTHILTRRMTISTSSSERFSILFNSHPHEEDDFFCVLLQCAILFSTHILTRRMTIQRAHGERVEVFQLTSSRGG